jgi:hypothetical protein
MRLAISLVAVLVGVLVIGRIVSIPSEKIKAGDIIQPLNLTNIHDVPVQVPDKKSKYVHLQFRRFAACPICNLHLHSFIDRLPEIKAAGIKEVVVFYSPKASLLPYQGKFPLDVIADPEKKLYQQFGVGSSIYAILDFRTWPAMVKGGSAKDKPAGGPEGGVLGLPADFLMGPDGKIVASHYGSYAYDQWTVDQLLALAK